MVCVSAFACLVVPYFVAAAVERVEPGLRERPFAVVTGTSPATRIVEANTVARALGVHPPMTETEARTRCPELTSRPLADEVQATACYALLDAALTVSPRVEDAGAGVAHAQQLVIDGLLPAFKMPTVFIGLRMHAVDVALAYASVLKEPAAPAQPAVASRPWNVWPRAMAAAPISAASR